MDIAIIGAGLMGRGIAQVLISNDYPTTLIDISEEILNQARNEIKKRLDRLVEKGQLESLDAVNRLDKLRLNPDLSSGITSASVVIECVPEHLTLKIKIIKEIQEYNPNCIIASNTSSISIDAIGDASERPDLIIGMHWFNPPPLMKLVEIIVGKKTSSDTYDTINQLTNDLGKTPIKVNDYPGFASSRLGVVLGLEAIRMVEQGVASPEAIDAALVLGYRHPMGPLELTDYVGLDTRLQIAEYLYESGISPAFEIPDLLRKMVAEGKLGRKTNQGFYPWIDGKRVV